MECTESREIVSAALDDQASHQELENVDRHLAGCAGCRSFRDDLAADRSLLQHWPDELPEDRASRRAVGIRQLAAAAVFVLAIGASFLVGRATSTAEVPSSVSGKNESYGSSPFVRQESMQYFPDSNEMHSIVVLKVEKRVQE